ncbi:MAG TPA: peptidoglycan DD-metalloendopeptidase family protein [Vicinamibacterales bacterium]|nr:peptidoglycan DD-metalloendopeptidase family protein [Vicinamibacterales bacterium]
MAQAQTPPGPAAALARAEQRMRELRREADRLAAQTGTLLGELRTLQIDREIRVHALARADAELAVVTTALTETAARLTALEAERVANTPGVRERLVEIYKRGRAGYVRLLLAADDLRALGRMSRGVTAVARLDRLRLDEHRRTIHAAQEAMADLEQRRAAMARAQAEAAQARRALDAAVAAHNRRIDDLDARRDLAARYVGELQSAATELQRQVDGLPSETPVALPLAPFRGTLEWPVNGRVVTRFGPNRDRFGTTITRHGIEIAAADGQDVRAVHGGTVAFASPFVGFGTLVILDHGGNAFTLYGHLEETAAEPGGRIDRGSMVGRAGRNPSGQPVVYFEVRIDGRPVDPVQWLRSSR